MRAFSIRPATLADADVMAETVRQGFAGYAAFLPPGWTPPPAELERAQIVDRLAQADTWCVVAHEGDRPAGHVGFLPARERIHRRVLIPGVAHLWLLFVREPWWGSGLASRLHGMAIDEAARRGFEAMRLYTPAGQARARAFYEREGWTTDGTAQFEPRLALDLVEYRRPLR